MFVYMLECEDGSYYTGVAKDLEKRMKNHGSGSRYTRAKKPKRLVYVEKTEEAYKREYRIKQLRRKHKEQLIASELNQVSEYNVPVS